MMQGEIITIAMGDLVGEAAKTKIEGYKFVTISCVETGDNSVELIYHFDRDFQLRNYRLAVAGDTPVPSISRVYLAAFLVENEIQDLFNVRFTDLAIDFNRTLYLEEEITTVPFCRYTIENEPAPAEEEPPPAPVDEPPAGE